MSFHKGQCIVAVAWTKKAGTHQICVYHILAI
jgi:hypothetical protein